MGDGVSSKYEMCFAFVIVHYLINIPSMLRSHCTYCHVMLDRVITGPKSSFYAFDRFTMGISTMQLQSLVHLWVAKHDGRHEMDASKNWGPR